jgi:hypothetical protein
VPGDADATSAAAIREIFGTNVGLAARLARGFRAIFFRTLVDAAGLDGGRAFTGFFAFTSRWSPLPTVFSAAASERFASASFFFARLSNFFARRYASLASLRLRLAAVDPCFAVSTAVLAMVTSARAFSTLPATLCEADGRFGFFMQRQC